MENDKKVKKSLFFSQFPNDDFGTVRERRDFSPMDITRTPILPSPFRDHSFSCLTGFRYYPTANPEDRLSIKIDGVPSTFMTIPDSWNDRRIDHSRAIESTRRQLEKLEALERYKRRKVIGTDDGAFSHLAFNLNLSGGLSTSVIPAVAVEHLQPTKPTANKNAGISIDGQTGATEPTTSSNTTATSEPTSNETPAAQVSRKVMPKQELYFMYGKRPFKVQLSGTDYLTWDNGKAGSDIRYTSAFVCPITSEIFLAASYLDTPHEVKDGFHWYVKKTFAEHAAAARAWDCWNAREGRHQKDRLSEDPPYRVGDEPELITSRFPLEVQEKFKAIEIKRERWKKNEREREAEAARTPTTSSATGQNYSEYDSRAVHQAISGRGAALERLPGSEYRSYSRNRRYRDDSRGGYRHAAHSYDDPSHHYSRPNDEAIFQSPDYGSHWGDHSNNYSWGHQQQQARPSYGHDAAVGYGGPCDQARAYNRQVYGNISFSRKEDEDPRDQRPEG
jgi:hypothetical protein